MRHGSKGLVVVDVESLGLYHNSVLLSVGLCVAPWKPQTIAELKANSINIKLDVREQITKFGMVMDKSVTDWWKVQSEAARAVLQPSPEDVSLTLLPAKIKEFLDALGIDWKDYDTYDRRNFDMPKLQHIYEDVLGFGHGNVPWNFSHLYEVGTALAYLGVDRYAGIREGHFPELTYHNSQDDAVLDAYRILTSLEKVGILS